MVNLNVFKGAEHENDNENASLALVFLVIEVFQNCPLKTMHAKSMHAQLEVFPRWKVTDGVIALPAFCILLLMIP